MSSPDIINGPEGYFASSVATSLLVASGGNIKHIEVGWLSLLAIPGTMLYHKDEMAATAGYVVGRNEYGVTLWLGKPEVKNGQRIFNMIVPVDKPAWKFLHITKLEGWLCQETTPLPPCKRLALGGDGQPLGIVIGCLSDKALPLLRAAALHAFKGMTIPNLKKLINYLEIDVGAMPQLEHDVVRLLVKHCLPEKTEPEIADILARRHLHGYALAYQTDLTEAIVHECAPMVGLDTVKEMVDEVNNYHKHVDALKAVAPTVKKPAVKKKKLGESASASVAAARKYLPDDALLTQEFTWHTRFRVSYPSKRLPCEVTKSYKAEEEGSMTKSLRFCIRWAWEEHEFNTGDLCPYIFDD